MVNKLGAARGLGEQQMNYFRAQFIADLETEAPIAYGGARTLSADRRQLFIEFGLLTDLAMNVTDKVTFEPILVRPRAKLAGDPLYAFKGFFDVRIRQHDFSQGLYDAFEVWKAVQQKETRKILLLPNEPPQPAALDPNIGSAQLPRVQRRLDTIVNTVIDNLSTAERVLAKATFEWQIKIFIDKFLRSLE
jgi:hypothetical protein